MHHTWSFRREVRDDTAFTPTQLLIKLTYYYDNMLAVQKTITYPTNHLVVLHNVISLSSKRCTLFVRLSMGTETLVH